MGRPHKTVKQAQRYHLLRLFLYHLILCEPPLPLSLGEVSERSEDGEGNRCKTLSVTCGDSSPGGRAKKVILTEMERIGTDTLHESFYGPPPNLAGVFYSA